MAVQARNEPMKRAGFCLLLIASWVGTSLPAWAQQAARAARPNPVARYIQAIQKRDYKTVIDLTYAYQQEVEQIKAQNPKVLWPKMVGEYYQSKTATLTQNEGYWGDYGQALLAMGGDPTQAIRAIAGLFPSSCKWTITETRRTGGEGDAFNVYVTATYPVWQDAPLVGTKLLDRTIAVFSVSNTGLITEGLGRVRAADIYKKDPLRILYLVVGPPGFGSVLDYSVVGGTPPLTCTAELGASHATKDCSSDLASQGYTNFQSNDFQPVYNEQGQGQVQAHLVVTDAAGKSDEVSLLVPLFPSSLFPKVERYCWVREPWLGKKLGRPPDDFFCANPINRLGGPTDSTPNPVAETVTPKAHAAPAATAVAAACADYDSCFKSGLAAMRVHNYQQAVRDFQAATSSDGSRPDAWRVLAFSLLDRGQCPEAVEAFDKVLQVGGTLFLGGWYRNGQSLANFRPNFSLRLSTATVSLNLSIGGKAETVFSTSPSQITSHGTEKDSPSSPELVFQLTVGGKSYRLYPYPMGLICVGGPVCPEPGASRQAMLAKYLDHAISTLASGALSAPEQPLLEAPKPAANSAGRNVAEPAQTTAPIIKTFVLSEAFGAREVVQFQLAQPGDIVLNAAWEGNAPLALI